MRSFLCFLSLLFSAQCFSQQEAVVVGTAKAGEAKLAELSFTVNKDTSYALKFHNQQFPQKGEWQTISFVQKGDAFQQLVQGLRSVFKPENLRNRNYVITMTLGKDDIIISNHKELGANYALLTTAYGYVKFTEAQLDQLFGSSRQ